MKHTTFTHHHVWGQTTWGCPSVATQQADRSSLLDVIARRRSVRDFSEKDIGDDLLRMLLEAARTAPSVHNVQPWLFGIVRGQKKQSVSEVLHRHSATMMIGFHAVMEQAARIIQSAPVAVVVWNRCPISCRIAKVKDIDPEYVEQVKSYEVQSVAAAIENMWLAATSLGLGMSWLGIAAFCEQEINRLLGAQGSLIAILAVGYQHPGIQSPMTGRKAFEDTVHFFS